MTPVSFRLSQRLGRFFRPSVFVYWKNGRVILTFLGLGFKFTMVMEEEDGLLRKKREDEIEDEDQLVG